MTIKLNATTELYRFASELPADAVKNFKVGDKITAGDDWIQVTDMLISLPSSGPVVAVKYMQQLKGQRSAGTLTLEDFLRLLDGNLGAHLQVAATVENPKDK